MDNDPQHQPPPESERTVVRPRPGARAGSAAATVSSKAAGTVASAAGASCIGASCIGGSCRAALTRCERSSHFSIDQRLLRCGSCYFNKFYSNSKR